MPSMHTDWIDEVLRLNAHILRVEARLTAQAATIVEMMEAGEDTAGAEGLHRAYQNDVRRLRGLRDTLLDEIKDNR